MSGLLEKTSHFNKFLKSVEPNLSSQFILLGTVDDLKIPMAKDEATVNDKVGWEWSCG